MTPFNDLIYNDEDASEASQLSVGKIIGFSMSTWDNDDTRYEDGFGRGIAISLSRGWKGMIDTDLFVDGLPMGAEEPILDEGSAVAPSTWGRIKAALK